MEHKYSKLNSACLLVLTAVAFTMALVWTKIVLVPLVFAIFAYTIVSPIINWLETRANLYRSIAVTLTVAFFMVGSFLLMYFIISSVGGFLEGAKAYQNRIQDFLSWISKEGQAYGLEIKVATFRDVLDRMGVFSMAEGAMGWIVNFTANFLLVVVIVSFMLAGEGTGAAENSFYQEIHHRISRYVAIKSLISITTGILVGTVLKIFNVELAFMFAILTMLLNFIPSVGSIVATALPVPVLMLQFEFTWPLFVVFGLISLIQVAFGYIIEPKMMGDSMELHPITVLLCLIFWSLVWGVSGLFLAVPITAVVRMVLSRIDMTRPISEILAGRLPEDSDMTLDFSGAS